jgi:hypothetical protein
VAAAVRHRTSPYRRADFDGTIDGSRRIGARGTEIQSVTEESAEHPARIDASVLAIDLARRVVDVIAPEEDAVFDEVASSWRAGSAAGRPPGGSIGFGIETALVSELALQVVAGSLVEVIGFGVTAARSWWPPGRRRRKVIAASRLAVEVSAVDGRIALSAAQAAELRTVARRHAVTLGMGKARADLLADAVVGAVHILDAPPPDGRI